MTAGFVLRGVTVRRGDHTVLDAVDAEIPGQGVTALWGPSGAGKSTLLRLLDRLDVPDDGSITYEGTALDEMDPHELRRRVGMVFQRATPFAGSVADNLAVAAPDADRDAMGEALRRVSLDPELLDRDADTLSGGELQRMCLARTLITEPETLLLDEPTSALDATPAREFERTVLALVDDGDLTVVWVGHDDAQVRRVADRVLELRDGALVESREWDLTRGRTS
ncbi:ATP-binding cassette domain-containing protein [Actinomycetospora sp. NBRC 106378]|uniref:ATP-binding cassette domain-containing protein n=1 Tax=Actinomycetospora sp. NBRC 106378 TaxID=3032208 RepID=UPI0024A5B60B|nr:ATP-binding cassette domain-containing protein [Actinomycetospora sp. NBRC 106378]GLZ55736.1 phosphate ABC transporter ATP-binding protein [Actinomycetospora sp. NBRC 106378]